MTKNIIRNFRGRNWTLVEWRCCGNLWELILAPMFPDRKYWNPVCPDCGETVENHMYSQNRGNK